MGVFGLAGQTAHGSSQVLHCGAAVDGGLGGRGTAQTEVGFGLPHDTRYADQRWQDGDLAGRATTGDLDSLDRIRGLEDESPRHRRERMIED